MPDGQKDLHQICINTLRILAADAIQEARSGHPGLPLGAAAMAYVLWTKFLRYNPANPCWINRDRFVHSAGHGSALLYSLLHLTGFDISLDDVKQFRQWESKTPGHPEYCLECGIEATTGPLGQGFGMGVGMALAERFLAAEFNRPGFPLMDHFTYAIVSDGDLMEGVACEAASIAGHLRLGKLIYLYDDNHITIEGDTMLTFTENVQGRFESYGWHVQRVADGNDLASIEDAISEAKLKTERPSLIMIRTHIGFGSPKQDSASAHGEPLGEDGLKATKEAFGWPVEPSFHIPEEAVSQFSLALDRGRKLETEWQEMFSVYRRDFPSEAESFERQFSGKLPSDWDADIPLFKSEDAAIATRVASGKVLNAIAKRVPNLLGGSADLAPSTKTLISGSPDQAFESAGGRNIRFGIREHAMGAMVNGMALHGGVIPYRIYFPDLFRLLTAFSAGRGPYECPFHLRLHPRQHCRGGGWPHASAGGALGFAEGHAELDGRKARGCQRDRGCVEGGHATLSTRRFDPEPPESAHHRPGTLRQGRRFGKRGLYFVGCTGDSGHSADGHRL